MKDHQDPPAQLVYQVPQASKDPQALLEILVTGVLLVVLVCLVLMVCQVPLVLC